MTQTAEKASRAKRLRENETFQMFVSEILDDQQAVFMNAHSTPEAREQAHTIVRAIFLITAKIETAETDARFEQKKERSAPQ